MSYEEYIKNPNKCLYCGKPILPKEGQYISEIKDKKFCNLSCCGHYQAKIKKERSLKEYLESPNKCLYCEKPILPKEGQRLADVKIKKFCCSSCAASYNNKKVPKRIKVEKNNKCLSYGKELKYVKSNEKYSDNKIEKNKCHNCGKEVDKKFCSNKCQMEYKYKQFIKEWKEGLQDGIASGYQTSNYIRRYLFEKYDNKCCKCGWSKTNPISGKIPLQVHHIDGNYKNNKEDNLELLCPNCHSLTPNYGALNLGKGRDGRYDKK